MFETLGIDSTQEAVYAELLAARRADITQLGYRLPYSRSRLLRALAQLETFGLASRLPGRPSRYTAVPPDLALEALIRDREQRLSQLRLVAGRLGADFRASQPTDEPSAVIELVHGTEAIRQRWLQLQTTAQKQVRALVKAPFVGAANNPVEMDTIERITHRAIYARELLDLPDLLNHMRQMRSAGEDSRITDDVPLKLTIVDDRIALAPLTVTGAVETAIIVHRCSLLDALCALFEKLWAEAWPFRTTRMEPTAPGDLDADDQQLLDMLAAAQTEPAIARQLGLSQRTVQRRIQTLLLRLGARTRFQAGMQAIRQGRL